MPERPNVLVVLTDQQRWDTVGAYGSRMDLTRNVDEMAEEGTLVEQMFTPQPVCGPARGCIQTGQYATDHGNWKNSHTTIPSENTLADIFSQNGYDVGYVGKWHLGASDLETDPTPFDQRGGYDGYWRASNILEFTSHAYEGHIYDENGNEIRFEDRYRVDAITDFAETFIRRDRDNPFFCFLSYIEPHHQNDRETYDAPDGYAERYANPWVPEDLKDIPGDWNEELPSYYGICRRIDENLGRLLDVLDDEGLDDTVVLFTSDHGNHFRTRNAEYKRSCHEASIRVPAIFHGPGFENGRRIHELASLLDVPATLLDSAGLDVPESMVGRSLVPLATEPADEWREEVFIQISEAEVGRAIRTDRWKYSVFDPTADGGETPASDTYIERYLYDLTADPYEQVNLVARDDYQDVARNLRQRLQTHIETIENRTVQIESSL